MHVTESEELTTRVRSEVSSNFGQEPLSQIDLKKLSNIPLLASLYAETLRLYVETFTLVSAPLENVSLGKFWLPKGQLGIVNSALAHQDHEFWNTQDGVRPLKSFWPDRFITDPADPSSGPSKMVRQSTNPDNPNDKAAFFSVKGLEGSWIPYGGEFDLEIFLLHVRLQPLIMFPCRRWSPGMSRKISGQECHDLLKHIDD